jgi:hypothetical protein
VSAAVSLGDTCTMPSEHHNPRVGENLEARRFAVHALDVQFAEVRVNEES